MPNTASFYTSSFNFHACSGQSLDKLHRQRLLAYLTNGGHTGASASAQAPPGFDTVTTIWWAFVEGMDPFSSGTTDHDAAVNCMDRSWVATADCKYPVCATTTKLWQAGYGVIVCERLRRAMWANVPAMFPGDSPRSIGQRVLAATQGGGALSFPEVSWTDYLDK